MSRSVSPVPGLRGLRRVAATLMLVFAAAASATAQTAPYPPSPAITGIAWAPVSSIAKAALGSDNWPITWADDDTQYTAFGDGWGFDPRVPSKLSLGLANITGPAASFSGVNVRSPGIEQPGDDASGKKASGMLMVDGVLYVWVRNADNNGHQCQLAWSTDHGVSWTWSGWKIAELGYCSFLNFGRNYAGAKDSYVYSYSPNTSSAYDETDEVVLMRVPMAEVTDRTAYEFFVATDDSANPTWTSDIAQRGAVFSFPGGCNRQDVTHHPSSGRYLMTMRSRARNRGIDHFGIYDAPEPWGPWTTVFFTTSWDTDPGESQHLPSKWMSNDGVSLYLLFSGGDSFSVRQATLTVAGPHTMPPSDPQNLRLSLDASGATVLTWEVGREADLAGYHVYRTNNVYWQERSTPRRKWFRLDPTPTSQARFVDTRPFGPGRMLFFYYVTAVDASGHESLTAPRPWPRRPRTVAPVRSPRR